ncbi:MAG TPA: DUF120 domain-containing protein [Longimicrobiales bacterium]|nr:DUF120 domain-containing protein [Longimicrobiales bacterium]
MERVLDGIVSDGKKVAGRVLGRYIDQIRATVRLPSLLPNTLNVNLQFPYRLRPDFTISRHDWAHHEDVSFEACRVGDVPAVIMRTSTNYHGDHVLEIMAEVNLREALGVETGDAVEVTVFAPAD